jgi:hypothetical protein
MENGESRRAVRGMIVRGIKLKTFLSIPLTIIPLTLDFSRKTVCWESCRECVILTDCRDGKTLFAFAPLRLCVKKACDGW